MADYFDQFRSAPAAPPTDFFEQFRPKPDSLERAKTALEEQNRRLYEAAAPPPKPTDPGMLAAVGHGLQSGLTLGWQPKIEAAVTAGLGQMANAMGGHEGSFGDIYQRELARNRAETEAARTAHPVASTAADIVGGLPAFSTGVNPILTAALGGGARSAGESKNVAGEESLLSPRGLAETAGGAATGAITAYLLPKVFGALGRGRGRAADEAAEQAVTFGTQSARDKFNAAMAPVRAMSPGGEMAPGEVATLLRESGAAGGFRGQKGTLKGIQSAKDALGSEFRGIINEADRAHPGVPLSSIQNHLAQAGEENLANNSMKTVADDAMERVQRMAGDKAFISHGDLQDVLETLNKTARKIYKKPSNSWSEHNEAFIAGYKALRAAQGEGLEAATGVNANDLRKYLATYYSLEPVAQKALNRFEGNDKIGLLGELQKSRGMTGVGHGALMLATGNPMVGGGLILKGALDVARGQLGKATAPLRSNLATSINLGLQKPLNALSQSELAQLTAAKLAAEYGGEGAGVLYDRYGPVVPMQPPTPPEIARAKGK